MDVYELITFKGFLNSFWAEYRAGQISQEKVFDSLNEAYFDKFGEYRFKSFSAFRYQRDVKNK